MIVGSLCLELIDTAGPREDTTTQHSKTAADADGPIERQRNDGSVGHPRMPQIRLVKWVRKGVALDTNRPFHHW